MSRASHAAAAPPGSFFRRAPELWICLGLALASLYSYGPVWNYGILTTWDDPKFLTANPWVPRGLTWEGTWWALTSGYFSSWHPVAWLSLMLDVQWFGVNPAAVHRVNLLLHILNTLLLFGWLRRLTGAAGRSGFVAALFALHPLHVESVAWLSERKDVLSAMFFWLTLWAYVEYARRPRWSRYLAVVMLFALGLMAKPMLVTLPLVLLLLDCWPLRRLTACRQWDPAAPGTTPASLAGRSGLGLLAEKVPLLLLSLASGIITLLVQQQEGALGALEGSSWDARLSNAIVSYLAYIGAMLWPARLAPLYPFPQSLPAGLVITALLTLALISLAAIFQFRRRPYLLVGWFWYLITLLPVIGFIQMGNHSRADRYTYLPLVGLFWIASWGIPELLAKTAHARWLPAVALLVLIGCALATRRQVRFWADDETLWRHAAAVTRGNYVAHNNLGFVLMQQGRDREAMAHLEEALRIKPDYPDASNNLGLVLARQGRLAEAIAFYRIALRSKPHYAAIHLNLGTALAQQGRVEEAVGHLLEAVRLEPALPEAHNSLANARLRQGQTDEAISHFEAALRLRPNYPEAHSNLGVALAQAGRIEEAIAHYSEALKGLPRLASLHYRLAALLRHQGRLEEAVRHYAETLRLEPDHAGARAALRELGRPEGGTARP